MILVRLAALARRHVPDLPALTDVERDDLAELYADVLGRFDCALRVTSPVRRRLAAGAGPRPPGGVAPCGRSPEQTFGSTTSSPRSAPRSFDLRLGPVRCDRIAELRVSDQSELRGRPGIGIHNARWRRRALTGPLPFRPRSGSEGVKPIPDNRPVLASRAYGNGLAGSFLVKAMGPGTRHPGGSGRSHHVGPTASMTSRRFLQRTADTVQQLFSRSHPWPLVRPHAAAPPLPSAGALRCKGIRATAA